MIRREQLVSVIRGGNGSIHNRLILKQNGDFELIPFSIEDSHSFEALDYVTRWETFDAGNDYVGIEASKDKIFIDNIMLWANLAWKEYKQTGQVKILNPTS